MTSSPTPALNVDCNRADFIGDVTIKDNTILQLSQPFTKTWRIKNAGTCTWTTAYKLILVGGDPMGSLPSVSMPINVAPGQTVDLSVNMTAPSAAGHYEGVWQLQAADGKTFGVGTAAKDNIWIRIRVIPPAFATATSTAASETPSPTFTELPSSTLEPTFEPSPAPEVRYSFAANPCDAQWQSNTGILTCPGKEGDSNGFILMLDQAQLEDGTTASLPTLLTFPQNSADGYILGVYPEYEVQPGDHFQASVGCEKDATACSVLFRLSYLDSASTPHDLWSVGEFYDGKYVKLDLDLAQLAGQKVKFILYVSALGSSEQDRALWVDPRLVHFPVPTPTAVDTPTPTLPPDTATPSPTATLPPTVAPPPTPAPTAIPPASPAPSIQQVFDSIISFFQQLFGGK